MDHRAVLGLQRRQHQPVSGKIAEAHHRPAPGCSAAGLQEVAAPRRQFDGEGFAPLTQQRYRRVELACRRRRQPIAEGDKGVAILGHSGDPRQLPGDHRQAVAGLEGDQPFLADAEEGFGAIDRGAQIRRRIAQLGVLAFRSVARPNENDRADDRESNDSEQRGDVDDVGCPQLSDGTGEPIGKNAGLRRTGDAGE